MPCRAILSAIAGLALLVPSIHAAEVPDGWASEAPREEIKPEFSYEPTGGRSGKGAFIIEADDRAGLAGWWTTTRLDINGGKHYRFRCIRQIEGAAVPRRSALVRILWQDAAGKQVTRDEPAPDGYRKGHAGPMEAEHPQDGAAVSGDWIEVTVPSWRLDLTIEVDLVEEVARVIGYGNIPVREEISIRLAPPNREAVTMEEIRASLIGSGYYEALTFSFVSDLLRDDFVPPKAKSLLRADPTVRKADAHLRPSILPGLLEALRRNESAGVMGAKLFETGSTFWTNEKGQPEERRRLGLMGSADYREVRGAVEALLERLNRDLNVSVVPDQRPGFAAGACGRVEWGAKKVGYVGRIDRAIADKLGLRELPAAAELELSVLLEHAQLVPQLRPLAKFPAVRRDLSLVVSEGTRYEQVDRLIRQVRPEHLEDLEYVTTYRGKPLEKGQKSVTVTLVFRSEKGTLTSDEVERSVDRVVKAAAEQLGATLRV